MGSQLGFLRLRQETVAIEFYRVWDRPESRTIREWRVAVGNADAYRWNRPSTAVALRRAYKTTVEWPDIARKQVFLLGSMPEKIPAILIRGKYQVW